MGEDYVWEVMKDVPSLVTRMNLGDKVSLVGRTPNGISEVVLTVTEIPYSMSEKFTGVSLNGVVFQFGAENIQKVTPGE